MVEELYRYFGGTLQLPTSQFSIIGETSNDPPNILAQHTVEGGFDIDWATEIRVPEEKIIVIGAASNFRVKGNTHGNTRGKSRPRPDSPAKTLSCIHGSTEDRVKRFADITDEILYSCPRTGVSGGDDEPDDETDSESSDDEEIGAALESVLISGGDDTNITQYII